MPHAPEHHELDRMVHACAALMCFRSDLRSFPHGRAGHKKLADPRSMGPALHRPRCLKRHGLAFCPWSFMHIPETSWKDDPPTSATYGGFGPDLPCYPPLSHGSPGFVVDHRRTRRFRAHHRWGGLTV